MKFAMEIHHLKLEKRINIVYAPVRAMPGASYGDFAWYGLVRDDGHRAVAIAAAGMQPLAHSHGSCL
jgi:hypothetical protein